MESMSSSIEPVPMVPRTANLLACKQWWRVCFLYGDQQKYYRQVYSKAAAQRLALSTNGGGTPMPHGFTTADNNDDENDNDNENETPSGKDSGCSGSMQNADYDTVASDFIEMQLDETDANAGTTTITAADVINITDMDKNHNQDVDKQFKKKKKPKGSKEGDEQAPPVPLFPSKCEMNAIGPPASTTAASTTSRGKKLFRSLRGHVSRSGEKSGRKSSKERAKNGAHDPLNPATSEPTKVNARVTVLDDPFLFGIDADHLGDLVVRGKHYAPNTTEQISKYYNTYLAQAQLSVDTQCAIQMPDFGQHLPTAPSSPEQFGGSLPYEAGKLEEPKPALPPKKKKQSNYEGLGTLLNSSMVSGGVFVATPELQINAQDLQFLNLSMRNRSLPRSMKPFKDVPTDISFTFTEAESADALSSSHPVPLQKSATCEGDLNLGSHLMQGENDE